MASSSSATHSTDTPRIAVPAEYFVYVGEAEKDGNSLYRCLKCPTGIARKKDIDPRQGVDKFFRDGAAGLDSLKEYGYINKLYVTLNTGLPSSASVERLFLLGGRIFTPLRSRMTSEHFEMVMFLNVILNDDSLCQAQECHRELNPGRWPLRRVCYHTATCSLTQVDNALASNARGIGFTPQL